MEPCINCGIKIPFSSIKDHVNDCLGGSSSRNEQKTITECFEQSSRTTLLITSELEKLLEIFPKLEKEKAESLLESKPFHEVVESLVEIQETGIQSIELFRLKNKIEGQFTLDVERDHLWQNGISLYKTSLAKSDNLFKDLHVVFNGEVGVDAGALKIEFFTKFFEECRTSFFEEVNGYFIPKKSVGNLSIFKCIGVAIAHSIFQEGPSFSCLSPWCFDALLKEPEEKLLTMLKASDIPLNAGTAMLHTFISKIDAAETENEIIEIFNSEEGPAYEQIVNSSQWDITVSVSTKNRNQLLQMLIYDEVVVKREKQIKAIREGLNIGKLFAFVKSNSDEFFNAFVSTETSVTSAALSTIILFEMENISTTNLRVLNQFKRFLSSCRDSTARLLLKFATGFDKIPIFSPLKISIDFMEPSEGIFIKSQACVSTIRLPTVETSDEDFDKNILKALDFECEGFHDY